MHLEGFCQGFTILKVQNYKKAWMTSFMFKEFMYFSNGMFQVELF
jgi:hypothetical protein